MHNFIIEAAVSTPASASWAARESPVNGTEHGKYFWPVFCDLNLEKVSVGDSSWEVFSANQSEKPSIHLQNVQIGHWSSMISLHTLRTGAASLDPT